eukprot:gene13869-5298_t
MQPGAYPALVRVAHNRRWEGAERIAAGGLGDGEQRLRRGAGKRVRVPAWKSLQRHDAERKGMSVRDRQRRGRCAQGTEAQARWKARPPVQGAQREWRNRGQTGVKS